MPFQVSPGVVVTERDLTTVVPNVSTSIGAFAGAFQWGPVLQRVRIESENELVKTFGEPTADTAEYFWSAANYLAYSNNLLVVRNTEANAINAVVGDDNAGDAVKVNNTDDFDGTTFSTTATAPLFVAKYPGARGSSLKAIAVDSAGWASFSGLANSARTPDQKLLFANFDRAPGTSTDVAASGGSNDEMHILVIDENGLFSGVAGEILEAHAFVSKASDAKKIDGSSNYVKNVLRNESLYIWLGQILKITESTTDSGSEVDAGSLKAGNTFKLINAAADADKIIGGSFSGGSDGTYPLTPAKEQIAYNMFADAETVDISLLIGGPALQATAQHLVLTIAENRKDCIAFVSPSKASVVNAAVDSQTASIVSQKNAIGSSSYGVMDNAWKYQYDRYRDVFINVPMNGDIAGLCARTDFTNDAWFSPAGLNRGVIKNIVRPSWDASQGDRDELYKGGINPITTQLGAGNILFGDKTMLAVPSAFDRINVRRLFIVLEKAIAIAAKAMLFEFNDEFTRSQFVNIVTPFLREVQGRRGLTDFKVVCDSSNNTGQVIDTNNFVGDIYIKPNRSINFIQLNFIAARSDVSFSEIGG
jgi:phage tail sheath protein FI